MLLLIIINQRKYNVAAYNIKKVAFHGSLSISLFSQFKITNWLLQGIVELIKNVIICFNLIIAELKRKSNDTKMQL